MLFGFHQSSNWGNTIPNQMDNSMMRLYNQQGISFFWVANQIIDDVSRD